jgi:plasmid stabilization system protein ParE
MSKNTVILSTGAKETHRLILQFLYDISVDAALDFDEKVEILFTKLTSFKNLCPPSSKIPKYRRCFVNKNVSMIYEIQNDTIIVIVAFIDNRMEHDF